MGSVESDLRDILDLIWSPPPYFPVSANNSNTEFPRFNQYMKERKTSYTHLEKKSWYSY